MGWSNFVQISWQFHLLGATNCLGILDHLEDLDLLNGIVFGSVTIPLCWSKKCRIMDDHRLSKHIPTRHPSNGYIFPINAVNAQYSHKESDGFLLKPILSALIGCTPRAVDTP